MRSQLLPVVLFLLLLYSVGHDSYFYLLDRCFALSEAHSEARQATKTKGKERPCVLYLRNQLPGGLQPSEPLPVESLRLSHPSESSVRPAETKEVKHKCACALMFPQKYTSDLSPPYSKHS